jgi:hypothetical protein
LFKSNLSRVVLEDCKAIARELPDPPTEAWRRRWIAIIALLRAVGNVLQSTDYKTGDRSLRQAIDSQWRNVETTRPAIFWQFVKKERDGVLKTYAFTASQSVTVELGLPAHAVYTTTMTKGPFKARKPITVIQTAIEWWAEQLDWVDAEAARVRTREWQPD